MYGSRPFDIWCNGRLGQNCDLMPGVSLKLEKVLGSYHQPHLSCRDLPAVLTSFWHSYHVHAHEPLLSPPVTLNQIYL